MYVLAMNLPSGVAGQNHFSTKIVRAIQRRPSLANRVLSRATPVTLHDPRTGETYETLAIQAEGERLERVLEKVALGLYRYHFGQAWRGALKVIPEFLRFTQEERAAEWNQAMLESCDYANALFAQLPYFGDNPSIFQYQVVSATSESPTAIRMHFYGESRVLSVYGVTGGSQVITINR